MQPLPHHYSVSAEATPVGAVTLGSSGVAPLQSDGPAEFDGPGDLWSPETLLTAALVDCFVLSFRAVARASRFPWTRLDCTAEGTLERLERVTSFTAFTVKARLEVPQGTDVERARTLLAKAEEICLISNSLKGSHHLEAEVVAS
jgi:organic hydroperoxide reductase OsmC/OhrA